MKEMRDGFRDVSGQDAHTPRRDPSSCRPRALDRHPLRRNVAAMPLLFGMRDDQKREERSLARQIGLEKVAEMVWSGSAARPIGIYRCSAGTKPSVNVRRKATSASSS